MNTLYETYKSNNENPLSEEDFIALQSVMEEEDFQTLIGGEKKKNLPNETITNIPQSESPQMLNPLEQEMNIPLGSETDLMIQNNQPEQQSSLDLGSMLPTNSMESASTQVDVPQSLLDSYNNSLRTNNTPNFDFWDQAEKYVSSLKNTTKQSILQPNDNDVAFESNGMIEDSGTRTSIENDAEAIKAFTDQYKVPEYINGRYPKIDEYTQFGSDTIDASGNKVKSIQDYNDEVFKWSEEGKVQFVSDENGIIQKTPEGRSIFRITDKNWISEENARREKLNKDLDDSNINSAREIQIIEETPRTDLQKEIGSLASETGYILSNEDIEKANSLEDIYSLYASKLAEKELKSNPKLNYEEAYTRNLQKINPSYTDEQYIGAGTAIAASYERGIAMELENTLSTARGYGAKIDESIVNNLRSTEQKEERDFIQSRKNNPELLKELGKYWLEEGQWNIGTSKFKLQSQFDNFKSRSEFRKMVMGYAQSVNNNQKEFLNNKISVLSDKNVKDGLREDRINEITRLQNEIKNLDASTKAIGELNDSWKSTQKRYLDYEKQVQEDESGYQNGEILKVLKLTAGNVLNQTTDAVRGTIGGLLRITNLPFGNREYTDIISKVTEPTEIANIKSDGIFEGYTNYNLNGKTIRERKGFFYELKNGKEVPISLTSENQRDLKFVNNDREFSWKGMFGTTAGMATDMLMAETAGGFLAKGIGSLSRTNTLRNAAIILGEESAFVKSMQGLNKAIQNPINNGYSGWFIQTMDDNVKEGLAQGMNNSEANIYGSIQSAFTGLLSKINPDVKFFNTTKTFQQKLAYELLNKNKAKAIDLIKDYGKNITNHYVKEIAAENFQETVELLVSHGIKIVSNGNLSDKNFDKLSWDELKDTWLQTTLTVGALQLANRSVNGNNSKLAEHEGLVYNISQMSNQQKVAMLSMLNTNGLFSELKTNFINSDKSVDKLESQVNTMRDFINKIPEKENYSIPALAQAGVILQQIDTNRKYLDKVDPAFKSDIEEKIVSLEIQLKETLANDGKPNVNLNAKAGEEVFITKTEETTTDEETPQSTPQPETVQEQTTTPEATISENTTVEPTIENNVISDISNNTIENVENKNQTSQNETQNQSQEQSVEGNSTTPEQSIRETNETIENTQDQSENATSEIDFSNLTSELENFFSNEGTQGNTTSNDGGTEPIVSSLQQEEQRGQESVQESTETVEPTGGERDVEVTDKEIITNYGENGLSILSRFENSYPESNRKRIINNSIKIAELDGNPKPSLTDLAEAIQIETLYADNFNQWNTDLQIGNQEKSTIDRVSAVTGIDFNKTKKLKFNFENETEQEFDAKVDELFDKAPNDPVDMYEYLKNNTDDEVFEFLTESEETDFRIKADSELEKLIGENDFTDYESTINEIKRQRNLNILNSKSSFKDNQNRIADNIISTTEEFETPDGETSYRVTITDDSGNIIEDKNGDSSFEFATKEDANKFIAQKQRGFKLSTNKKGNNSTQTTETEPRNTSEYIGKKVTFDEFGEPKSGEVVGQKEGYLEIKGTDGKIYRSTSPLVKNLKLDNGQAVQYSASSLTSENTAKSLLQNILDLAFGRPKGTETYTLGKFTKDTIKVLSDLSGLRFKRDVEFSINESDLRHSKKHVGSREKDARNVPLTEEDFSQILNIISEPDRIEYIGEDSVNKLRLFEFQKNGTDGDYSVIVFVGNKGGKLGFKTFFKNKQGIHQRENAQNNRPSSNVRNRSVVHLRNTNIQKTIDYQSDDVKLHAAELTGEKRPISLEAAKALIEKLKIPFKVAFKNLDVTMDWDAFQKKAKSLGLNINFDTQFNIGQRKEKQLKLINKTNPAPNDYNTWVRTTDDILTAEEAFRAAFEDGEMYPDFTTEEMQDALDSGEVTVYSSYPIENGKFITPSRMNAEYYAGDGKVYSKTVKIDDVAWIDEGEGQYAPVQFMYNASGEIYGAKLPDGTIYLNPERLNANTPIHEFSHLWEQLMPNRWKDGVEIFKNTEIGKRVYNQLNQDGNYSNLTEEQIWSEALNTHIGNIGEENYQNPKGTMKKLADWIKNFFAKIGEVTGFNKIFGNDLSPETKLYNFTQGVLGDLLGGKTLLGEAEVSNNNNTQYSIVTKSNSIPNRDIVEVLQEAKANGRESGFEKLKETKWYNNLSDVKKQSLNSENYHAELIQSSQYNNDKKVANAKASAIKKVEKKDTEIKDIKSSLREKISDLKKEYTKLRKEWDKESNARKRLSEKIYWRKQAVNSIKVTLNDKVLSKNITSNELIRLINEAQKIEKARDINAAFDNFEITLGKIIEKAESRFSKKDEWDKINSSKDIPVDPKVEAPLYSTTNRTRFKQFREKWFSNQGGLLKPFMNGRDRAIGNTAWAVRTAKKTVSELTSIADKIKFNNDENWATFDKAMRGDIKAYDTLPEEIKPFVQRMREQIDGFSNFLIENNLVNEDQAANIEANIGTYVSRGYSYFDGDTTIEGVSKKFFRTLFKRQGDIRNKFDSTKWADAITVFQQNVLNEVANDTSGKFSELNTEEKKQTYARNEGERRLLEYIKLLESDFQKEGSGQGADTSVLERKKDVPEPIRKLLGEYTDPRISFALTVAKVSQMAYQRKFLSDVRELGMGTIFFKENDPNIPKTHYVKIASDGNESFSPLNGLYTTPEFKDVFLDVSPKMTNDLVKLWMSATGMIKVGKTVLSPITQGVNFFANFGFLINNGTILDIKQYGKAVQAFADDLSNGKIHNDIVQELVEENILGQNVNFKEIESDFGTNMEKEIIRGIQQNKFVKNGLGILSIPFRLYRGSDNFFKAYSYYSEADRYAKSMYKKPYKDLVGEQRKRVREIASEVTKNTLPNYDRRFKAADVPRKATLNLVGNFLAFQAESIRTKINSIQIAISDIKSEDRKSVGIKRLAGIMTYNAAYGIITTYLGKLSGMGLVGILGFFDDDEEDKNNKMFNMIVPEWARNTEKYMRVEKDRTITYYTYGNANPYGIWYKSANAYQTSENTKDGLINVFDEALTPFLGTEMSVKWALNTFYKEENDYGKKLLTKNDKINYTLDKLLPTAYKVYKDNTDLNDYNNFDLFNLAGIKKYNFDPTEQLRYKFADVQERVNALSKSKYGVEMKYKNNKLSKEDAEKEWNRYNDQQQKLVDEFKPIYNSYLYFGADPSETNEKGRIGYQMKFNGMKEWMDYLQSPEQE